jgi:hypothetical protein
LKKVLPVIIRGDGFSSRDELDKFLKLVEQLLSGGQIVKLRAAAHKAYEEISLPKHAPEEQENTSADVISLAQKIAREAVDATFKDLRNRGPLP